VDVRTTFNAIVGNLEYPMFIVTARNGDERLGCLVGFATQTSIDPPRFAACLSHKNRTYRRGRDADALGVHCVPADAPALAELFGGETGDEVDKFARCEWHDGPKGFRSSRRPRCASCAARRLLPHRGKREWRWSARLRFRSRRRCSARSSCALRACSATRSAGGRRGWPVLTHPRGA